MVAANGFEVVSVKYGTPPKCPMVCLHWSVYSPMSCSLVEYIQRASVVVVPNDTHDVRTLYFGSIEPHKLAQYICDIYRTRTSLFYLDNMTFLHLYVRHANSKWYTHLRLLPMAEK